MEKVKFTQEEEKAFIKYTETDLGSRNKEEILKGYINNNHRWHSEYKPLKDMGLFNFCSALLNGYEVEVIIPDAPFYNKNNIDISYNLDEISLKKEHDKDRIIYVKANYGPISIEETLKIIKVLQELVEHYNTYYKKGE